MTSWKVAANTVIKNNKFQPPQGIIFYLTSYEAQSPGRTILLTNFLILSVQVNLLFHYLKLMPKGYCLLSSDSNFILLSDFGILYYYYY